MNEEIIDDDSSSTEEKNNAKKDNILNELLNKINEAIDDNTQLPSEDNYLLSLRQSLYETFTFKKNIHLIKEIISKTKSAIFSISDKEKTIEILEKILMLFLFHFDIDINLIAFDIMNFLIEITDIEYHNEIILKFFEMLRVLVNKKENNRIISNEIIYNVSLVIALIARNRDIQEETINLIYDFIKENVNDIELIYHLMLPCSESLSYSSIFPTEKISDILSLYKVEANRRINEITEKNFKDEQLISKVTEMSMIFKITNSLSLKINRTYNIDKTLKNMLLVVRKVIDIIMKKGGENFNLSSEILLNILKFGASINAFDIPYALGSLEWHQKFIFGPKVTTLSPHAQVVSFLTKIFTFVSLREKRDKNKILGTISQILENLLDKFGVEDMDLATRLRLGEMWTCLFKIDSSFVPSESFPKSKEFFESNGNLDVKNYSEENTTFFSDKYMNSIERGKNGGEIKIKKNEALEGIEKFQEFVKSFKSICRDNNELKVEKNILELRGKLNESNDISIEKMKEFYLDNSILLFKELLSE